MPLRVAKVPLLLRLLAVVFLVLGSLVLALAGAVGFEVITWDVKGHLLTGWVLAVFSLAVAAVGVIAISAAYSLWNGQALGRVLALAFWIAAGLLALITDRSVAGPGEPLRTYLVDLMLLPGGATAALLWGVAPIRRFFRDQRLGDPR